MKGSKWSADEDAILRAEWDKGTLASDLGDMVGRSAAAVVSRAKILRLDRRLRGRKLRAPRPWSADEIERLLDLYAKGKTVTSIARALGRTHTSVEWRLMVLGVKKMDRSRTLPQPAPVYITKSCLRCHNKFQSEGKHNRICGRCKSGSVWKSGGDYEARI